MRRRRLGSKAHERRFELACTGGSMHWYSRRGSPGERMAFCDRCGAPKARCPHYDADHADGTCGRKTQVVTNSADPIHLVCTAGHVTRPGGSRELAQAMRYQGRLREALTARTALSAQPRAGIDREWP
jgi:hypothetical protein